MQLIMGYFLRAKHWQIFVLFGICFVAGMLGIVSTTARPTEGLGGVSLLYWIAVGLFEVCLIAWWWSLGSFLSSIVHPALRLSMEFFRFALIYPLIYTFAFVIFFLNQRPLLFAVMVPLHLFAMFCEFYGLYFVSKSLVLAETGKSASFYDYAGPFFLLWFFPLGLWIVQPRINRLYAENTNAKPIAGVNAGY